MTSDRLKFKEIKFIHIQIIVVFNLPFIKLGPIRIMPHFAKLIDRCVNHKLSRARTDDISGANFRPGQTNTTSYGSFFWNPHPHPPPYKRHGHLSIFTPKKPIAVCICYLLIFMKYSLYNIELLVLTKTFTFRNKSVNTNLNGIKKSFMSNY